MKLYRLIRRFRRDQSGAALVEFSVVAALFFFALFVAIDFGRLGFRQVAAQAAMRIAARTAAVRPPACPAFDATARYARGTVPSGTTAPRFGTSCKTAGYVCSAFTTVTCTGNTTNTTISEIWSKVAPLLPPGTTPQDLQFSYAYDQNLGYLGGRYVPRVTVALVNTNANDGNDPTRFTFLSPISAALTAAGGLSLPVSASLPGEDLCNATGDTTAECSGS